MHIGILRKGDEVLSVTHDYIAVKRKNKEVDLVPIARDGEFGIRVDTNHIVTIGFGDDEITVETADGGELTII